MEYSKRGADSGRLSHPQEALVDDMVRELTSMLRELGEVQDLGRREFEKGLYGCLMLRPNKKVATSLSTTREIAVVITPFSDLQQRTVKFAKQLIVDSKGRLDTSIALIAHQDSAGDAALREWGKDVALLILPIYLRGEWRSHSSIESLLSKHLYSSDPFDLAGPVRNEGQFYGRSDSADVARRLSQGMVKAYFGIRKIGKTSMMNRVIGHALKSCDTVCVTVDCQADAIWSLDAAHLLDSITAAVLEAAGDPESAYRSVTPSSLETTLADSQYQLQYAIDHSPRPVLVAIDEVDFITPSSPTGAHWRTNFNPFFRALRTVYQESCRTSGKLSILIGGVSSRWFFAESVDGVENAALGFVPEEYLGPFHRAQSVNMLKTLGRSAGLLFSDDAADVLAEGCGDFPFWIRKCGSYIHSSLDPDDRPVHVNVQQCRDLVGNFIELDGGQLAEVSLRHVLRVFPELIPVALSVYAGDEVRGRQEKRHLAILQRYGVVNDRGHFRGPLVTAGLEAALETVELEAAPTSVTGQARSVAELLDVMENDRTEFKSSACYSYKENVPERVVQDSIIKAVAALANADGGTLGIGIDDDGRVLGIEPDMKLKRLANLDAYTNFLTTLLVQSIGSASAALASIRFERMVEKTVCLVDVKPSGEPVFARTSKGDGVFFVRLNNSSRQMEGAELIKYTRARW